MLGPESFEVLDGRRPWWCQAADCVEFLSALPDGAASLVLGSPPYADARTYGRDDVALGCAEWVEWMLRVTAAATRASAGLVLWVCAGVQRDNNYWPCCEGLAWEWWRLGNRQWRPCIWHKNEGDFDDPAGVGGVGIPGSGGRQWLRSDWEFILAFKREGWLPWADPLACGHEPRYQGVGGACTNRHADGRRANARPGKGHLERLKAERAGGAAKLAADDVIDDDPWDKRGRGNNLGGRHADGSVKKGTGRNPPGQTRRPTGAMKQTASRNADGTAKARQGGYARPALANPGNVIKARVGGNQMGSRKCHDSEAPYPEKLVDFFVRSFCPVGGLVVDPFSGSGTTLAVAHRLRRRALGCDLRESHAALSRKRVSEETPLLFGYGEEETP